MDAHKDGWLLVETPHIALRTDLERDDAIARAKQLERYWQALVRMYGLVMPGAVAPQGQFSVIHFKRRSDFRRVSRPQYAGFVFGSGDWMDGAVAVTFDRGGDATLVHELTHVFNHHYLRGLPVWAQEGLACYYETLTIKDGAAVVGAFPIKFSYYARKPAWLPSLAELRRMEYEQFHEESREGGTYFSAWRLVHMLNSTGPDRQQRFRRFLANVGQAVTSEEAWVKAFGDLPAGPLEEEYRTYQRRERLNGWGMRFRGSEPTVQSVRPMRAGEVHLLWAVLFANHEDSASAAKHLQRIAAVDPDWPELLYWRAVLVRPADSLKLLREYVGRQPKDGRGWRALVNLELDSAVKPGYVGLDGAPPPALAAMAGDVRKLIEHASDATSLNTIGWYFALRQNPVTGLNFAIRAVQADPRCGGCWDTAALLYYEAGKLREALKAQEHAASLYADKAPPEVSARLRRFRAAASAAAARK